MRRVFLIAAAAVVIAIGAWRWHRPAPGERDTPVAPPRALGTSRVRAIEARISYAAADAHRPYDTARAGNAPSPADAISLEALAQLEQRGDYHGVAAASLLAGELSRAATYLDRAVPGLDVAADRALLQLAAGHPGDALITLDRVLAAAPRHPQALWNR
ncbi:MAG TPA: hypothetical protein VF469_09925, partial [Kofleriaceae bacterium]